MIEIKCVENFEEIDKIADELLSEHDNENKVEYSFERFAFVAKYNGEKVGYLTGFSYYKEVTVNNLVVLKNYRRMGIGTSLMKHVEEYFKCKNFNNINLVTNGFQAPKFYEKCGFELEFIRKNKEDSKFNKYFFVRYFNK